jgi:tetratricopeptide (TPR) repeat protein
MPEDEAIVDYLLLADKYFAQGDFARARKAYEHVLKLDPSNTSARIGKANAIQAEAEGRAGTRSGTRGRMLDNQPLRPLRQQKKPRVDMGELMDAFTDNKES